MRNFARLSNGKLPDRTMPGMYPILYHTQNGAILCAECANGANGSLAKEGHEDPQWNIVNQFVFFEGEPLTCDHCQQVIHSAYDEQEGT